MMGGAMAPSDADASVNEVDFDAGGFDLPKLPPGSNIISKEANASSTLGLMEATAVAWLVERSRGRGKEEIETAPGLPCLVEWWAR